MATTPPPPAARNLGPTSRALVDRVAADVDGLRAEGGVGPMPADLVTASGSGLDPHIVAGGGAGPDPAGRPGARPAGRAGRASWSSARSRAALLGFIGEPRVNVLQLNLALDDTARCAG